MKKHHIYSLISSIISLVVTCGLLIVCLFAWYTNNKNVSANGIVGSTADSNYDFKLEMFKGDDYSEINTDKIDLGDLNPGDLFYFRIKVNKKSKTPTDGLKFNIKFSGVESKLSDKLQINENYISYKYADDIYVDLYEIKNDKVLTDAEDILYEVLTKDNKQVISLSNFRIQDVFKVYSNVKNTDSISEGMLLSSNDIVLNASNDNDAFYCYFALEFNELLSSVTIDGVKSSNAYMFQDLIIKSIDIKEANTNE